MLIVKNRIKYAQDLVDHTKFVAKNIKTDSFHLFSYQKITDKSDKVLNVYIEGDGLAWRSRYRLSHNPTPTNPISLKMALKDNASNILYLARPCQYIDFDISKKCTNQEYWSKARISKEVILSMSEAINKLKEEYGCEKINLFGFSGGGAIAVLIASVRKDVLSIKTVAANLDHESLSKAHKTTPLNQSLNPIDFAKDVSQIDQLHLAGVQDRTVLYQVIESFVLKVNKYSNIGARACLKIIKEADHEYNKWPEIWSKIVNSKVIICN
jgi:hypothetical protein